MCNVVYSYPAMTSPLLGSFINERDCRNNCRGATPTYAALPKFGADTMGVINQQSRIWYNGAWTLIGTPYATYTMNNGAGDNIGLSGVSGGVFTQTWQTSAANVNLGINGGV